MWEIDKMIKLIKILNRFNIEIQFFGLIFISLAIFNNSMHILEWLSFFLNNETISTINNFYAASSNKEFGFERTLELIALSTPFSLIIAFIWIMSCGFFLICADWVLVEVNKIDILSECEKESEEYFDCLESKLKNAILGKEKFAKKTIILNVTLIFLEIIGLLVIYNDIDIINIRSISFVVSLGLVIALIYFVIWYNLYVRKKDLAYDLKITQIKDEIALVKKGK